jgi:hypothetical protein
MHEFFQKRQNSTSQKDERYIWSLRKTYATILAKIIVDTACVKQK